MKGIKSLMMIFQVSRVTIYNWFDAWEDLQSGYMIESGRKPKFNSEQKEQIVRWAKEFPQKIGERKN